MNFTPTEWEILKHRLEVPDAIAEALTDHCEGEEPATKDSYERVYAIAEEVLNKGPKGDYYLTRELLILKECCEGSTFFADIDDAVARGELKKSKMYHQLAAAESMGKKLGVQVCTL